MTNFEKWKAKLTIEDCVEWFGEPVNLLVCKNYCKYQNGCEDDYDEMICDDAFSEWANEEAGDE